MAKNRGVLSKSVDILLYGIGKSLDNVAEIISPAIILLSKGSDWPEEKHPSHYRIDVEFPRFSLACLGHTEGSLRPVKEMLKDISKSFSPYKDFGHDLKKDLKMPWFGLQNLLGAALSLPLLAAAVVLYVPNQLYSIGKTALSTLYRHGWKNFSLSQLFLGIFLKALLVEALLEPLTVTFEVVAFVVEALLQSVRGASQIVIGTPALLIRVPMRMALSYALDPQVEDSAKIQSYVDQRLDGFLTRGMLHSKFEKSTQDYHRSSTIDRNLERWAYEKSNNYSDEVNTNLVYFGLFREIKYPESRERRPEYQHLVYNRETATKAWEDDGSPTYGL